MIDTSDRAQHQAHIFQHVFTPSCKRRRKYFICCNTCAVWSGPVRILYLQSGPVRMVRSEKYPQPKPALLLLHLTTPPRKCGTHPLITDSTVNESTSDSMTCTDCQCL